MTSKSVHTTIPTKYYDYAINKKLSFSELLTKAIERKMNGDFNNLQERIKIREEELLELEAKAEAAQKQDETKKSKLRQMQQGGRII